jgi:hypothetical protein
MSPRTYFRDKTRRDKIGRQTTTYVAKNVNSRHNSPRTIPQPLAMEHNETPSLRWGLFPS